MLLFCAVFLSLTPALQCSGLVPDAPLGVRAVDVWSRSARIQWSASPQPVNGYTVEYWTDSGGHWKEGVSGSALSSVILRDLWPFTNYTFHVWASNVAGDSRPSHPSQFTTAKEEPSSAPLDFRVEDVGPTFVVLSWKAPPREDWNSPLLSGYYVGHRRSGSLFPFTYSTVEEPHEEAVVRFILRGLITSTRYQLTVMAYNKVGGGPHAQTKEVRTLDQVPPPQPTLAIEDIGSTYLQVRWDLPQSHSTTPDLILHYRKVGGGGWVELSIPDPSQSSLTLTDLDPSTLYQLYLGSGIREPSQVATVRTTPERLTHPLNTDVKRASESVDEVTQILYIVLPVAVATVIIVIVIVTACVYVYSKRPLPPSYLYQDVSRGYLPPFQLPPPSQAGSTLTRRAEDEEPIYEAIVDDKSRFKMNQQRQAFEGGMATIV